MNFNSLALQYKNELFDNILPFWMKHSHDRKYGGYFTCLQRNGEVFDTDKFVWLQARQVWMFAKLFNEVEKRNEWLEMAVSGAEFLRKYGQDGKLNWYFSVTREGRPLIQPYNIFSYTFAAMAFGQLCLAEGNKEYAEIAKKTFDNILLKKENPKGQWNKAYPGTRNLKNFTLPMILCNLSLELEHLLENSTIEKLVNSCIHEVMEEFYDPESGLIMENVTSNGELSDTFDGRLINPGHAIEAMWFIMDLGNRLNSPDLIRRANDIALRMLVYGWDKKYDGIYYFMDRLGHPLQQLEWDQKLWWVHIESCVAMLMGYACTGKKENLYWFDKVHQYTWKHFKDSDYREWFGYLNRRGEVLLPLKGGKWKGCFHVPRGLYQCWKVLEKLVVE